MIQNLRVIAKKLVVRSAVLIIINERIFLENLLIET